MINSRECWDYDVAVDDVNDDRTGDACPSNAGRIIPPQGNGVYVPGVDANKDDIRDGDVFESVVDVV